MPTFTCPKCGLQGMIGDRCTACGADLHPTVEHRELGLHSTTADEHAQPRRRPSKKYLDALPRYGVANAYANGIRIIGWIIVFAGILVAILSMAASQQAGAGAPLLGVLIALSPIAFGLFLIAIGQLISAVLDTAMHSAMTVLLLQDQT